MQGKFDPRAAIVAHPFQAAAIAFVAGAGLAILERPRTVFGRLVRLGVHGAVYTVVRELVGRHAAATLHSWIDERVRPHASA